MQYFQSSIKAKSIQKAIVSQIHTHAHAHTHYLLELLLKPKYVDT